MKLTPWAVVKVQQAMTYEKFMEQVKEQILSFLPEGYANADVTIQEVSKNNNQKFPRSNNRNV